MKLAHWTGGVFLAVVSLQFGIAHAATCQDLLNLAAESDRRAVGQIPRDAAFFREAAQNYRNAYNASCTGSRGSSAGSYSGGSAGSNRLEALGSIFGNLAGMAAIMEQKRQREQAEAQQRDIDAAIQRVQQQQEEAKRQVEADRATAVAKVQADRAAAIAKAEDDRKRRAMSADFGGGVVGGAGATTLNPFDTSARPGQKGNPTDAPGATTPNSFDTSPRAAQPANPFDAPRAVAWTGPEGTSYVIPPGHVLCRAAKGNLKLEVVPT